MRINSQNVDNDVIISPFNVFFDEELIKNHFDSSADSRKSDFDFEKQIILFRIWQLKIVFLAILTKIMKTERAFL